MMPATGGYELKFSHHVVEHLGLKLYQNKPTNVIAELVSNAWDANANKVTISIHNSDDPSQKYIAVSDNGSGMTPAGLREDYLVIGKPKRRKPGARYEMGRKGIGKLAPFGIAHVVDVVTVTATTATWLRLRLSKLLGESASKPASEVASYEPDIVLEAASLEDFPGDEDKTGAVAEFSRFLDGGTGTLILLTDLSLLRAVPPARIKEGMGRRFTVTLGRPDFSVSVNGEPITDAAALPQFDFRIPESGFTTESVAGNDVRYWAGFVKTAAWPSDEAGVGV